jgi:hypothetical protein
LLLILNQKIDNSGFVGVGVTVFVGVIVGVLLGYGVGIGICLSSQPKETKKDKFLVISPIIGITETPSPPPPKIVIDGKLV